MASAQRGALAHAGAEGGAGARGAAGAGDRGATSARRSAGAAPARPVTPPRPRSPPRGCACTKRRANLRSSRRQRLARWESWRPRSECRSRRSARCGSTFPRSMRCPMRSASAMHAARRCATAWTCASGCSSSRPPTPRSSWRSRASIRRCRCGPAICGTRATTSGCWRWTCLLRRCSAMPRAFAVAQSAPGDGGADRLARPGRDHRRDRHRARCLSAIRRRRQVGASGERHCSSRAAARRRSSSTPAMRIASMRPRLASRQWLVERNVADARTGAQRALGRLEDALQRPLAGGSDAGLLGGDRAGGRRGAMRLYPQRRPHRRDGGDHRRARLGVGLLRARRAAVAGRGHGRADPDRVYGRVAGRLQHRHRQSREPEGERNGNRQARSRARPGERRGLRDGGRSACAVRSARPISHRGVRGAGAAGGGREQPRRVRARAQSSTRTIEISPSAPCSPLRRSGRATKRA